MKANTTQWPSIFEWLDKAPEPKTEDTHILQASIEIGLKPSGKIAKTPLMVKFLEIKAKHPDAIILFRLGDFYETFGEDAKIASDTLGITLTRRANGKAEYIYLAGFPHQALDTYLPRLVRAGHRICICEEIKAPTPKPHTTK